MSHDSADDVVRIGPLALDTLRERAAADFVVWLSERGGTVRLYADGSVAIANLATIDVSPYTRSEALATLRRYADVIHAWRWSGADVVM